jgi:mono/diheme cytochrome c family protein
MISRLAHTLLLSIVPLAASCGNLAAATKKEARGKQATVAAPVAPACATPTPTPAPAGSVPVPVTGPESQAALVAFSAKCAACHAATPPVLTSLASAAQSKAAILASIDANQMPPSGSPPLTEAEIAAIKAWAAASLALSDVAASAAALTGGAALLDGATAEQTWVGSGSGTDGIAAVMRDKCATCHSATAPADVRQAPYLSSYLEFKASYLPSATRIAINSMPPAGSPALGPHDSTDIAAFAATSFPYNSDSLAHKRGKRMYYDPMIKPVVDAQCGGCHGAGGTPPDLSSYDAVRASAIASLASMTNGTMPPGGAVDGAFVADLMAWIDGNMENVDVSAGASGGAGSATATTEQTAGCTP